jgi:hypothetical protein
MAELAKVAAEKAKIPFIDSLVNYHLDHVKDRYNSVIKADKLLLIAGGTRPVEIKSRAKKTTVRMVQVPDTVAHVEKLELTYALKQLLMSAVYSGFMGIKEDWRVEDKGNAPERRVWNLLDSPTSASLRQFAVLASDHPVHKYVKKGSGTWIGNQRRRLMGKPEKISKGSKDVGEIDNKLISIVESAITDNNFVDIEDKRTLKQKKEYLFADGELIERVSHKPTIVPAKITRDGSVESPKVIPAPPDSYVLRPGYSFIIKGSNPTKAGLTKLVREVYAKANQLRRTYPEIAKLFEFKTREEAAKTTKKK